ncbi:hypothetical protein H4582DRAFT_2028142 [Lactarius indigo]|nr:hypothetical protein H4582DRAFT_2028142 [Lactarius indigo]
MPVPFRCHVWTSRLLSPAIVLSSLFALTFSSRTFSISIRVYEQGPLMISNAAFPHPFHLLIQWQSLNSCSNF